MVWNDGVQYAGTNTDACANFSILRLEESATKRETFGAHEPAASNMSTLTLALHRPMARTMPQMLPPTIGTRKSRGLVSIDTGVNQRKMRAFFCGRWMTKLQNYPCSFKAAAANCA